MKRLSHKALKNEGARLGGIELNCNCYTYENAIHFISRLEKIEIGSYLCGDNDEYINSIIEKIKAIYPDSKGCIYTQLYYSAGTYGNNGQLHQFEILDSDYNRTGETFYIYF